MKIQIVLIVVLLFAISVVSCGQTSLSKAEVQRQIAALKTENNHEPCILVQRFAKLYSGPKYRGEYILKLQEKGYINFQTEENTSDIMAAGVQEITNFQVFDKAKPYATEDNGAYFFSMGMYQPAIISMTEPAADAMGTIVCTVTFEDSVALNDLGQELGFSYLDNGRSRDRKAVFTKMQDGWVIDKHRSRVND